MGLFPASRGYCSWVSSQLEGHAALTDLLHKYSHTHWSYPLVYASRTVLGHLQIPTGVSARQCWWPFPSVWSVSATRLSGGTPGVGPWRLNQTCPDVNSSPVVSTSCQLSRRLLPDSVQSDGFIYSATDSPTDQAPTMHPEPTFNPSLCLEGPFKVANPHPRIGDDKGGCAYWFTTYRDSDFADQDQHFGLQLHHPRFLEWVGAPESVSLLGRRARDPSKWIRSMSQTIGGKPSTLRDNYSKTIVWWRQTLMSLTSMLSASRGRRRSYWNWWWGVKTFRPQLWILPRRFHGLPCFRAHGSYGPVVPSAKPWWAGSGLWPSGPGCPRPSCLHAVIDWLTVGSCSAGCWMDEWTWTLLYISVIAIWLDFNLENQPV